MEDNTSKVFVGRADSLLAAAPSNTPASTLFIINLCSSIAPVQTAGKTIPGFENHKLYQVARAEDGRTRHRLRLGFFTSEADAENALVSVRDNYPTAFVTCLTEDDRRFARGFLPNSEMTGAWKRPTLVPKPETPAPTPAAVAPAPAAAKAPMPAAKATPAAPTPAKAAAPAPVAKPAEQVASQPAAPKPEIRKAEPAPAPVAAKPTPAPTPAEAVEIEMSWDPPALTPAKPAASSAPAPQTIAASTATDKVIKAKPAPAPKAIEAPKPAAPKSEISLTLETEPAPAKPAAPTQSQAPAQPFHVGKGVEIPTSALSLEAAAPPPAAAKPVQAPAATAVKPEPVRKPVEAKPAAAAPAPAATQGRAPELDSTQTIRALTSAELNDDSQEKWYSIQLVVSERPVNLDAMPHLDIFEAYRVYSIANAGSGKIVYSLRLGFFREEVSAEAVTGYLRTFFPSPSVIRISAAEQARFKDAPAPKATAAAKTDIDKVIDLDKARDRKPVIPTVTMEVADRSPTGTFKPSATGTFKVDASGKHKSLKPAAKNAAHATKRSAPLAKTSSTGKHKALKPRSLQEQLLDEARNVQLSESAIRKLPKNDSLLSRLVGKLTK